MGKIDLWKFVKKSEKDELRTNLTGLGYKDGYVYATDAHILLRQKDPYAKKYEGKVISKEGKVISEKPPKYADVIPDLKLYRPWRIDTSRLDLTIKRGVYHNSKIKKMPRYERYSVPEILNVVLYEKDSRNNRRKVIAIGLSYAKKLLYYLEKSGTDTIWTKAEGSTMRPLIAYNKDTLFMLMPVLSLDENQEVHCPIYPIREEKTQTKPQKPTTMKKSACSRKTTANKARKSATTVKDASRILKAQKEDYQKIFRTEVKKAKNPKTGAKKAGQIYRDRYGATATARWKKALKRAK